MTSAATQRQLQAQPALLIASSNAGVRQRILMRLRAEFTGGLGTEEAVAMDPIW